MSTIKKVIEVLASSDKSFEDAVQRALQEASTTVKGIKGIYIKDQSCKVQDNKIVEYRVTAKISFEVMHRWEPAHLPAAAEADFPQTSALDGGHAHPGGSATSPESGGGYSN
ncbi:dodecin family protein [Hymenobacter sp. B81]|uniref:dodecin family protein n=1 Tax=Hymenobacter sp. B81 TaxID=3344878 RepID=UPI0037DCCF56